METWLPTTYVIPTTSLASWFFMTMMTEEQKIGIMQRLGKKVRQYGAAAALGMGVAGGSFCD